MLMDKPTVERVVQHIAATLPASWGGGFMPVFVEGNRLWLRHPDRDTIIRIEVTELPRQDWPSLPELVR